MKVYCLFGKGWGDDEDEWCLSSIHSTMAAAEAAKQRIIEDDPYAEMKIEEWPVE